MDKRKTKNSMGSLPPKEIRKYLKRKVIYNGRMVNKWVLENFLPMSYITRPPEGGNSYGGYGMGL